MKRTTLIATLALITLGFLSCQGPASAPTTMAAANDTITANPHGGGGQRVSYADIADCAAAYKTVMATYGITADSPSAPMGKCPPQTYRITTNEALTYTTLRRWLDSVVNVIDSAGHGSNVNFNIVPGICTSKFVANYGLSSARTGRISFFLVPSLIDSSRSTRSNLGGGGGGDGYEIGGIEP
jgi:hypothetical protein